MTTAAKPLKKTLPDGTTVTYARERTPSTLTSASAVRVFRELQGLTQAELALACGIPQPTLSGIEKGRIAIGVERAGRLAQALRVHPAVLLFPGWKLMPPAKGAKAGAPRARRAG